MTEMSVNYKIKRTARSVNYVITSLDRNVGNLRLGQNVPKVLRVRVFRLYTKTYPDQKVIEDLQRVG